MSWDTPTSEYRIARLEEQLQEFREVVNDLGAGREDPTNVDTSSFGARIQAASVTGAIKYPFVFSPVDHRRFDTEPPPQGGGDVFDTIFIRSTSVVVTQKGAEDPMNVETISDAIHDGQIILITANEGVELVLKAPVSAGANINITSDVTVTDDSIIFLQWQENSPIATSTSGSWVIVGGTTGGTSSPNEVLDSLFRIIDNVDNTKKFGFQVDPITTGTTKIATVQNANGTLAYLDGDNGATQVFENHVRMLNANIELNTEFLSGTSSSITNTTGSLRFVNNSIFLSLRNAGDTGQLEFKYDGSNALDITESNNNPVSIKIRAQHATEADNTTTIIQWSGNTNGGAFQIDATKQFDLLVGNDLYFNCIPANNTVTFIKETNHSNLFINEVLGVIFVGFSGSGLAISQDLTGTGGLFYDVENSSHQHTFRHGALLNEVLHISGAELQLYSPLDFVPEASATGDLNLGSPTETWNNVECDEIRFYHNDGITAGTPSIGTSGGDLLLNAPTGDQILLQINATTFFGTSLTGDGLEVASNLASGIRWLSSGAFLQINKVGTARALFTSEDSFEFYTVNDTAPIFKHKSENSTNGATVFEETYNANSFTSVEREYARVEYEILDSDNTNEESQVRFAIMEAGVPNVGYLAFNSQFQAVQIFRDLNFGSNAICNIQSSWAEFSGRADTGAPALGDRILFSNSTNSDHLTIRTPTGTVDLEAAAGGGFPVSDTLFDVHDDVDTTKHIKFQVSGISTATTRTFTWQDATGVVALLTGGINQTFTNDVAMIGDVTLGSGSADDIIFNGDTVGHITPNLDNNYDLGASTQEFRDLWIDGTANIDTAQLGTTNITGTLTTFGLTNIGGTNCNILSSTINIGDSSSDNVLFNARIDTSMVPDNDNSFDLGAVGLEWRNLFIDGTANIDTLDTLGILMNQGSIQDVGSLTRGGSVKVNLFGDDLILFAPDDVIMRVTGSGDLIQISDGGDRIHYEWSNDDFSPLDNIANLGKSGRRWVAVWAVNGSIQTSFTPFKTDITPTSDSDCNAICQQLEPIMWKWKPETFKDMKDPDKTVEMAKTHFGYNADALKTLMPEAVAGDDGIYERSVVGLLIGTIRHLNKRIETLENA